MGRSKFPGKPSKLVNKKRISVLAGSAKSGNCDTSADDDDTDNQYSPNDQSLWSSRHDSEPPSSPTHLHTTTTAHSPAPSCSFHEDGDNVQALHTQEVTSQGSDLRRSVNGEESKSAEDVTDRVGMHKSEVASESRPKDKLGEKSTKKKTVTFKNVLETSDDVLVRKSYNPDFAPPLVPIIKKESLTRIESSIVRPSRLTEVMKQNSNNQDNIKALSFRLLGTSGDAAVQSNGKDEEEAPGEEDEDGEANGEGGRRGEGGLIRDKRFILPKRSLHSCRVIKPNKKFLDNMDDCSSKKRLQLSIKRKNQLDGVEKKKRMLKEVTFQDSFINSTLSSKISNSKLDTENCGESETSQTQSENSDAEETDEEESKLNGDKKTKRNEQQRLFCKSIFHSTSGKTATPSTQNVGNSSGKVILRQPRLQFSTGMIISSSASSNSVASTSNSTTSTMSLMEKTFSFNLNGNSIKNSISSHSVSLPSSSTLSMTSTCGICGTVSSCRYTQKCRKFGINSCEACRKFISKMIKKLAASSAVNGQSGPMQCSKGDGTCIIQPMPRGGHLKTMKATLKERCHACWLKRCIKSFQVPSGLKSRLIATLPATMRDFEPNNLGVSSKFSIKRETENQNSMNIFSNPPSTDRMLDIEFKTTKSLPFSNPLVENNATFGSSPLMVPTISEKPVIMVHSPTTVVTESGTKVKVNPEEGKHDSANRKSSVKAGSNNSVINASGSSSESVDEKTKPSRKKSEAPQVNGSKEVNSPSDATAPKRQRIDLKGPRVKHVCRSASIVLGQPIATFPSASPLENLDTPPRPDSPNNEVDVLPTIVDQPSDMCTDCGDLGLSPPATPIDSPNDEAEVPTVPEEDVKKNKGPVEESQKPITRKLSRPSYNATNLGNRATSISATKRIQQLTAVQNPMVSIDFWENYDPAEVSQTGFGLILSESVPLRAICFLCGSAGTDALIFCICCCEPYHQYCVEDEYNLKSLDDTGISVLDTSGNNQSVKNRLNWLCPRCTVCYTCNMATGSKVKCQKCQKNYHSTCLGTSKRLLGADRPLICANCLKCKSCTTTNVTKFVGNLPMCTACFKLRQKGNFCPLCQKCYEDNDFDLKMMECGDCKRWVHAKCEGLTDEQYNMLSVLPESIEFICKKCAKNNPMVDMWRDAVAAEFKSGLLSVVKMLSKSRPASALLKLSPRKKSNICACQPIMSSRSIQFKKLTEGNLENSTSEDADFPDNVSSEKTLDGEAECNAPDPSQNTQCYCGVKQKLAYATSSPSLLDIKRKINDNDYVSLQEFNYDMLKIINSVSCEDLVTAYKEILSETFPWFQNETKACTDALEEDMYDSCDFTTNPDTMAMECDQMVPTVNIPEDGEEYFYGSYERMDDRTCLFCKQTGEQMKLQEGRLLYCGQNSWVHTNCALWSAEVFEEIDGSLQNVHSAVSRGRMIKCTECGNKGATVGCNVKNCGEHFHYPCARTAKCVFMSDKTVYCPRHESETTKKKCHPEGDFDVHRPVYVELDRRRKKSVEPGKVQFAIGALAVRNIGRFVPILSDLSDVIVPSDFLCTRLYWSTKEPWKIVEYTIKTSIQCSSSTHCTDLGKNFTVDHSSHIQLIQKGLNQIAKWHSSLSNGEETADHARGDPKAKQTFESMGNADEPNDEEPQSNADLLPPEIKEAIFEDLPHDILDGISMLDIFPKLMTYEDLVAMDSKSEIYFGGELIKDAKEYISEDDINNQSLENWSNSSTVAHVEDPLLSASRPISTTMSKELKRSKSEVFSRGVNATRNHQRSSSLTWNCKVEQSAVSKRRKVSMLQELRLPESVFRSLGRPDIKTATSGDRKITWSAKKLLQIENENSQEGGVEKKSVEKLKISQLDGMDDISSGSESGSPGPQYAVGHQIIHFDPNGGENPVKCDRCHCTYRTQDSFQRHLLTCEPMSTSESESEANPHTPEAEVASIAPNNMLTVTVSDMCNSSTISTIQPQNLMQNFSGQIIGGGNMNAIQTIPNQGANTITIPSSLQNIIPIQGGGQISLQNPTQIQTVPLSGVNQLSQINAGMSNVLMTTPQNQQFAQQLGVNNFQQQVFPLQNINQYNDMNSNYLQKTQRILPQTSTIQPTIQLSGGINIQNFNNSPIIQPAVSQATQPQIISIGGTSNNSQIMTLAPAPIRPNGALAMQTPHKNQIILPQPADKGAKKHALPRLQSAPVVKSKGRQTAGKNQPIQMKKIVTKPDARSLQIVNSTHLPIIRPQQTVSTPTTLATATTNPGVVFQPPQPLIVQPMGNNTNLVQYVTDNGMQYIAMPSGDYKQPQTQYLTPSPIVPGAFQLQTDTSGQLVLANTASGLQVLPSGAMQLAQPQQPQVIGTIIQPQATTIQCGMMATEQMMLGSTPTLEMVTDPNSGCMYLTSQPVYYGLETIVQNTVMSSQQFVSTAMQGVLSQNSSFSATTTQVFQASKIEPIMEVPGGYVVLNNMQDQQQTSAIMPNTQVIPQIQAQPQVTQQMRPISPPKPTVKTAPIVMTKVQPQVINKVMPSLPANMVSVEQQPTPQPMKPQVQQVILPKTMAITSTSTTPVFQQAVLQPQEAHPSSAKTLIVTSPNSVHPIPRAANIIKPIKTHMNSATVKPKIITKPVAGRTSVNRPKGTFTLKQTPSNAINQVTKNDSIVGDVIITTVAQNNMQSQMVSSQQSNQQIFPVEQENVVQNIIQLSSTSEVKTGPQEGVVFTPINRSQQNTHGYQANPTPTPQIQLPSAPYAPSHHSNVPTNVVNPIQQCHYGGNTTNSRPTNRVLPMQTIQARQSPPTPPEPKCQVEEPVIPPKLEEVPVKEDVVMADLPSPQLIIEEAEKEEPPQILQEDFEDVEIHREKESSSPTGLNLKNLFQTDVQADLFDQIKSMDDKDESSSESSTPEVKQKICEILVNLDKEECNKSNVLLDTPMEEVIEQKENLNPLTAAPHDVTFKQPQPRSSITIQRSLNALQPLKVPPGPRMLYEIQSEDGFHYKSTSITDIWDKVFEAVQIARKSHGLSSLPDGPLADMSGHQMLGLKSNALRYLIEQLPGVETCKNYTPKYHERKMNKDTAPLFPHFIDFDDSKENIFGAARCEPYSGRSEYDMFSWLASRHRKQPAPVTIQLDSEITIPRRGSASNLPMAMRYRTLKETSKDSVGVYRSHIHGRGLFCTRDIEAGEMVIEYAGELIRATLTDKRENYYESKGIGCYMFRIDDNFVVDATMRGNAARFINHSCEPNCYSKVVDILGHKHIIIFALRRIVPGEELTYDYKFPFEDIKIPCSCGSKRCRKYLN